MAAEAVTIRASNARASWRIGQTYPRTRIPDPIRPEWRVGRDFGRLSRWAVFGRFDTFFCRPTTKPVSAGIPRVRLKPDLTGGLNVKKLACVTVLTFGLVACNGGKAPENNLAADASGTTGNAATAPISAATSAPAAPVASFKEVTIPSGTTLRLSLQSAVASDTSSVEQPVRATLRSPVSVNGQVVVPVGSEVGGVVTEAEESGRVKGRARLAMRFNPVHTRGEGYG